MNTAEKEVAAVSRTIYFDYLRAFATVAVITIHVSAMHWYSGDVTSVNWNLLNFYNGITSWAVPVFVMISGALFLNNNKQISILSLYTKNIKRIVCCYIFWSAIYTVNQLAMGMTMKNAILYFIRGNYHLWFLFMIVSLYIIIPLLRKITASFEITKYFLILALVFTFIFPRTFQLLIMFDIPHTASLLDAFLDAGADFNWHITLGYSSYFILGYYLSTAEFSKNQLRIIYIFGIAGFLGVFGLSAIHSIYVGTPSSHFLGAFSISMLLESTVVFVAGKHTLSSIRENSALHRILSQISRYSFGIYLSHAMIIEKLEMWLNFCAISFTPLLAVPAVVLSVLCISLAITFVLDKIPLVKKNFL